MRPDWEKVVTPVVDVAVKLPGVDPEKIILAGWSFGGFLVVRAAAFEPLRWKLLQRGPLVHAVDNLFDYLKELLAF